MPAQHERHEDQRILGPLVQAGFLDPILEARRTLYGVLDRRQAGRCASHATGGFDQNGALCVFPDGKVGLAVARINEAVGKHFGQLFGFRGALEIGDAVGGNRPVYEGKAASYPYGQQAVGGGCEDDFAALGLFRFRISDDFVVEGNVVDLERHVPGQLLLEMGFALEQPCNEREQAERVLLEIGENRLVQQIGADQGVVEVENERDESRLDLPIGIDLFDRNG